jgi:DNA/RNA endonuclease YhcR with UshA esterase domain
MKLRAFTSPYQPIGLMKSHALESIAIRTVHRLSVVATLLALAISGTAMAQGAFEPVIKPGELIDSANSNLPRPVEKPGIVLEVAVGQNNIPADGQTSTKVTVRLLDDAGKPVKGLGVATIEFSGGRIKLPNQLTDESGAGRGDLDRVSPGVQVQLKDGVGTFDLIAPPDPKDVTLRVTSEGRSVTGVVRYVADKRELVGIGVIEGIVLMQNRANGKLGPSGTGRTDDGIEKELRNIQREFNQGKSVAALSAELYFKGLVKGDYLLTVAYDSDKATRSRLFRDIQPEEYYPVYGDASIKGFDARSAARLYVRVDKDRSYLLYGDINTASQFEAQSLASYSRSQTGAKYHYETATVSANVFAVQDNLKQVVDEQPARGVSGPYFVNNLNGVRYTEKVEIITRDRNQPNVILSITPQARFVDYTFEPFNGQVLFTSPIPTLDQNFNPLTIRITYEVEQGGPTFLTAGADVQFKVSDNVVVGAAVAQDKNPLSPYKLYGVNTSVRLDANTAVIFELARSDGQLTFGTTAPTALPNGAAIPGSGSAARIEYRSSGQNGSLRLYAARAGIGFANPNAQISAGRTELAARGEYKLTDTFKIFGEATKSEDGVTLAQRTTVSGGVGAQVSKEFSVDVFARKSQDEGAVVASLNQTNVGTFNPSTGQTLNPFNPNAPTPAGAQLTNASSIGLRARYKLNEKSEAFGELEHEVAGEQRNRIAVGADYQIAERLRAYGRHEWLSATSNTAGLQASDLSRQTVLGVSSNYIRNGEVFSEYRVRDAIGGYESQASMGLRNTWPLAEGLNLQTNLERVQTLVAKNQASPFTPTRGTAGGVGVEYTANPDFKASGRVEARQDSQNSQILATAAATLKLDYNLTGLGRNYYNRSWSRAGLGGRTENRFQLGVAWRDTDVNVWNWLARYEYRYQNDSALASVSRKSILAGALNYHPNRPLWLSGQIAALFDHGATDGKFSAWQTGGRVIYDLTERWDVSAAGFVLNETGGVSRRQYALGLEGGYLLAQNLWLSAGYNFKGFASNDLTLDDYTNRGIYIRLRAKFDETLFGINHLDDRTGTNPRLGPIDKAADTPAQGK